MKNMERDAKRLKGYMSLSETAKELGISRQGVAYNIEHGNLSPVYYVDVYYLIPETTIKRFKKTRKSA